jgi:hypothetical protein|uniref:Uncharacterized protein n=1 Tax=viral metagenome TaxID=1070528 RepID=A0A6C0LZI1_9ZZZZ
MVQSYYVSPSGTNVSYVPIQIKDNRDAYEATLHALFKHVADFHLCLVRTFSQKYGIAEDDIINTIRESQEFKNMQVDPALTMHDSLGYLTEPQPKQSEPEPQPQPKQSEPEPQPVVKKRIVKKKSPVPVAVDHVHDVVDPVVAIVAVDPVPVAVDPVPVAVDPVPVAVDPVVAIVAVDPVVRKTIRKTTAKNTAPETRADDTHEVVKKKIIRKKLPVPETPAPAPEAAPEAAPAPAPEAPEAQSVISPMQKKVIRKKQ